MEAVGTISGGSWNNTHLGQQSLRFPGSEKVHDFSAEAKKRMSRCGDERCLACESVFLAMEAQHPAHLDRESLK